MKNNSTNTVANGIVVTDTLDPYVSSSEEGTLASNVITWEPFSLGLGNEKAFTVTVRVNDNAPTDNYTGTSAHNGSATATRISNADITNIVKFTMITKDPNPANNVWQEPTNVLPRTSVTAYKKWVGGPAEEHQPVTLTLYRQVEGGQKEEVTGVTPTITPITGPAATFTYTWSGLATYSPNNQLYTYSVDEAQVPEGYTKTIEGNTIINTYKPSLTILKVYGNLPLQGAVFDLYEGDESGPTGEALATVTTDSNGRAVFEALEAGTYWLVEAVPPLGYKSIDDIGPFIVSNGTITSPEGFTSVEDGVTGDYIITVQNEPVRELPATGSMGTIPFTAGGLLLMALAVFMKRRESDYKKTEGMA